MINIKNGHQLFINSASIMENTEERGEWLDGYLRAIEAGDCEYEEGSGRSLAFRIGWDHGWHHRGWGGTES